MGKYLGAEREFLFIPTGSSSENASPTPEVPPVLTNLGTKAELLITSEPSGATVTVDDRVVGKTPYTVVLTLGLMPKQTVQIGVGGIAGYADEVFTVVALRGKSLTVPTRQLMPRA